MGKNKTDAGKPEPELGGDDSDNSNDSNGANRIESGDDSELSSSNGSDNGSNGNDTETTGAEPIDGIGNPQSGVDGNSRKPRRGSNQGSESDGGRARKQAQKIPVLTPKNAANKTFAAQLVGLHAIAGILTGQPAICAISMEQSEALVNAITDVMAQYKIKPNPKIAAWAGLIGVASCVYVPKVIAFREVAKQRRGNVSPIRAQSTDAAKTDTPVPDAGTPGRMQFG